LKKCKTQRLTGAYNAADWELATNAVAQDTQYNKVKITTANGVQVFDASDVERVKVGQIDTESGVKATHTDGTYSQMTEAGFKRNVGGTDYTYMFMIYVNDGSTTGGGLNNPTNTVTVTLPSDFQGRDFKVTAFFQNWSGGIGSFESVAAIVCTITSINTVNGTFVVDAFVRKHNTNTLDDYYYPVDFAYMAQY
jgi:hypothetical protein